MSQYYSLIKTALREDIGKGDVTTNLLIDKDSGCIAKIIANEDGIICGLDIVKEVFRAVDKNIKFLARIRDGRRITKGKSIAEVCGKSRSILTAERSALNFLSHLSGIATQTRRFVEKVKPYEVKIMDTRKTIPGLRNLEKYAVRCGGGYNHRMSLSEHILIKDNHIRISHIAYRISHLVNIAKQKGPKGIKIEVEVSSLKEFREALRAKPDIIMLDNMNINEINKAVRVKNDTRDTRHETLIEVSGNVTLKNVRQIAQTGVDIISIGCITLSAHSLDISLEAERRLK